MRFVPIFLLFALVLGHAVEGPAALAEGNRVRQRARVTFARGQRALSRVDRATAPGRRLALLDRALVHLRRALRVAKDEERCACSTLRREVAARLADALNAKTRIYLRRGSLPQARRHNEEARAVAAPTAATLRLQAEIHRYLGIDIFEEVNGAAGVDRVRANRERAGVPIRDRGVARRR